MQASIDIAQLIDERPMSGAQWGVTIISALAIFVGGYAIQVMALTVPILSGEWALDPSSFGLALSAVSIGLGLAAAMIAPMGDKIGRRTMLTGALLLIGIATLGSALATSPTQLVFWRILTGIGIGAGVPNANAWTSEYSSARGRATLLVLINSAVGAGAFCAGLVTPAVLLYWGWQGTYILCGIAALALAVVLFAVAPESLKFLISRRPKDPRIASILKRIAPDVDPVMLARPEQTADAPKPFVSSLLRPEFRTRTFVLWGVILGNLFTMYFVISWLPTLLQSSGWSLADAVKSIAYVQLGGMAGGFILSLFLNRGQTVPALIVAFLIAATCLLLFLFVPSGNGWVPMIVLVGAGINGSQLALNALATGYYPPAIKATGMSWAGFVGTAGSIIAPNVGAWAITKHFMPTHILAALCIAPVLCAAGATLMRKEWQKN